MLAVEQSVEVAAALEAVYDAWTRFEALPTFIEDVEEVQQSDDTHLHLRLAGGELDVEIVEQRPCERIAWLAIAGEAHSGSIAFERVGGGRTRVTLRVEGDGGERFGRPSGSRVRADLERFKALLEGASAP